MNSWIVTGGLGCGKSAVVSLLGRVGLAGLTAFSCDQEAGRLMQDASIMARLEGIFGPSVIEQDPSSADGRRVSRSWLRRMIFSDPAQRHALEEMMHPRILEALEMERVRVREGGGELFLAEVPLHYEIGGIVTADRVIVVAASRAVQIRRLMELRELDQGTAERMLGSQWSVEAKVERADVVIWNDGDRAALEAQVLTLAKQLRPA
ncbi:MAG: Dephospho-CoA kinase [Prosthecobacter sp.]|nr:Dephospho-CoA kinase [Prosthecobacter sp.]